MERITLANARGLDLAGHLWPADGDMPWLAQHLAATSPELR